MLRDQLRQLMKARDIHSFDVLAEKVREQNPSLAGLPQGRGLAANLTKLNRGDDLWFRKRSHIARAVADVLDIDVDELLLPVARHVKSWTFQEFPQLPPLDLAKEEPCSLATLLGSNEGLIAGQDQESLHWSLLAGRVIGTEQRSAGPHWISAPPGSGKHLLAKWLAARGEATALEVRTLREAVGAAPPDGRGQWLVVIVAAADAASDHDALRALAQLRRITVLAPFEFPSREWTTQSNSALGFPLARDEVDKDGWRLSALHLASDWRTRLTRWVGQRLAGGNSLFDADQMQQWLQEQDRDGLRMPTPGDLLPLCALAHQHGASWFKRQSAAQISAKLLDGLVAQLPEDLDGRLWLAASAGAALGHLAVGRLSDLGHPLRGGSPASVWACYLPSSALPARTSEKQIIAELAHLRRLKSLKRKQAEAAVAGLLSAPKPIEAVALLERAGVLRTDRTGGLAAFPRLSFDAALRAAAADGVRSLAASMWGRWSAETERRQLLDETLDSLPMPELLATARKVLATYDSRHLGSVGAVESLFAAIARRLGNGWRPDGEATHGLLQEVWRQAESNRAPRNNQPGALRLPSTRVDGYWDQTEDFTANCWAWSVWTRRPEALHESDPPWLWPGWKNASLEDLCSATFSHKSPSYSGRRFRETPSLDRMFSVVGELASQWKETKLPSNIPELLVLHGIVKAAEDNWIMDNASDVRWQRWHSWLLAGVAAKLPPDVRQRIANWHLQRMLRHTGDRSDRDLAHLQQTDAFLHRFILDNADWRQASEHLAGHFTESLLRALPGYPEPLQELVIQQVIARTDLDPSSLILRARLDHPPMSATLLGRLLSEIIKVRNEYNWEVTRNMYDVDVAEGLKLAEQSWRRAPHSQQTMWWFVEAPSSMAVRAPLIELLARQQPAERPWWTRSFLSAMLHYAGERTDELFGLMQGTS